MRSQPGTYVLSYLVTLILLLLAHTSGRGSRQARTKRTNGPGIVTARTLHGRAQAPLGCGAARVTRSDLPARRQRPPQKKGVLLCDQAS